MDSGKRPPFKVLHLIDSLKAGGAQKIVYQLAVNADRRLYSHLVCSWRDSGPYIGFLKEKGIEARTLMIRRRSIILLPFFVFDIMRMLYGLLNLAKSRKVDIIHGHLPDSSMLAVLMGVILKKPSVITIHSSNIMPFNRQAPFRNRLRTSVIRFAFRKANVLIAVGDDVRKGQKKLLGNDIPITTIFNSIDYEKFAKQRNGGEIRKKMSIPQESLVITCVGRLVVMKGHSYLLKAVAQLKKKFPSICLLLVGDGPLLPDLREEIERMGLDGVVRLLGRRSDIPEILAASDLFVLPSFHEGIPLVVLEAMASQKPVVATNVQGTREIVSNGVDGFLVEPKNHIPLAERIDKLLSNPDLSSKMGQKGREKVERYFRLGKMVEKVEDIYKKLLETE